MYCASQLCLSMIGGVDELKPVPVGIGEGEAVLRTVGAAELESASGELARGCLQVVGIEHDPGRRAIVVYSRRRPAAGTEQELDRATAEPYELVPLNGDHIASEDIAIELHRLHW